MTNEEIKKLFLLYDTKMYRVARTILYDEQESKDVDCTDTVVSAAFAEEVLRVCRMMPRWISGEIYTDNGYRNVRAKYFQPFRFGEWESKGMRIR